MLYLSINLLDISLCVAFWSQLLLCLLYNLLSLVLNPILHSTSLFRTFIPVGLGHLLIYLPKPLEMCTTMPDILGFCWHTNSCVCVCYWRLTLGP